MPGPAAPVHDSGASPLAHGPVRMQGNLHADADPTGAGAPSGDSRPSEEPVVAFEEVVLQLGGATVLDGLSFDVAAGETFCLVGRSGSGKTSALRLVNRLLEPDAGRVLVRGRATTDRDPIDLRRGIGYVLQGIGLFPHLTVAENAALVPRLEGRAEEDRRRRAEELLAMVGLPPDEYADCRAASGSGWAWRGRWPPIPPCSSATSRSARWTPSPDGSCRTSSGTSPTGSARPCSS